MKMLEFISAHEPTKKWGIQKDGYKSYAKKRIPGVAKFSRMWLIPKNEIKYINKRRKGNL